MAQREQGREVLSAGAGLAAEVALESGGQLGEIQAVRARGYREQVWLRFKKDKVAIASGVRRAEPGFARWEPAGQGARTNSLIS